MKAYLRAMMIEQINRGETLKKLIPHPLAYSELERLSESCSRIIDENTRYLAYLLEELEKRQEDDVRDIFRGFRECVRQIEAVEYFGISALFYQVPEIGYLNKLIYKVHQEINLPITPPSVACLSTNYYYYYSFTNVIFVPIGEAEFLLNLPDLFHEIGHSVLFKKDELKLKRCGDAYFKTIAFITQHYKDLLVAKKRETGPQEILRLITHVHSQWKNYWVEEFFSDLFALYTLGPAYVWSHLHITSKKSENIYRFSPIFPDSHPSDDARMKMLLIGLELLGFKQEAANMISKWVSMPFCAVSSPMPEYQYAYSEKLMREVATLFLEGLKECNFKIITPAELRKLKKDSIVSVLNEGWGIFWGNPSDFRKWEEKAIQDLKTSLGLVKT